MNSSAKEMFMNFENMDGRVKVNDLALANLAYFRLVNRADRRTSLSGAV